MAPAVPRSRPAPADDGEPSPELVDQAALEEERKQHPDRFYKISVKPILIDDRPRPDFTDKLADFMGKHSENSPVWVTGKAVVKHYNEHKMQIPYEECKIIAENVDKMYWTESATRPSASPIGRKCSRNSHASFGMAYLQSFMYGSEAYYTSAEKSLYPTLWKSPSWMPTQVQEWADFIQQKMRDSAKPSPHSGSNHSSPDPIQSAAGTPNQTSRSPTPMPGSSKANKSSAKRKRDNSGTASRTQPAPQRATKKRSNLGLNLQTADTSSVTKPASVAASPKKTVPLAISAAASQRPSSAQSDPPKKDTQKRAANKNPRLQSFQGGTSQVVPPSLQISKTIPEPQPVSDPSITTPKHSGIFGAAALNQSQSFGAVTPNQAHIFGAATPDPSQSLAFGTPVPYSLSSYHAPASRQSQQLNASPNPFRNFGQPSQTPFTNQNKNTRSSLFQQFGGGTPTTPAFQALQSGGSSFQNTPSIEHGSRQVQSDIMTEMKQTRNDVQSIKSIVQACSELCGNVGNMVSSADLPNINVRLEAILGYARSQQDLHDTVKEMSAAFQRWHTTTNDLIDALHKFTDRLNLHWEQHDRLKQQETGHHQPIVIADDSNHNSDSENADNESTDGEDNGTRTEHKQHEEQQRQTSHSGTAGLDPETPLGRPLLNPNLRLNFDPHDKVAVRAFLKDEKARKKASKQPQRPQTVPPSANSRETALRALQMMQDEEEEDEGEDENGEAEE
jgi:hypothetical protein